MTKYFAVVHGCEFVDAYTSREDAEDDAEGMNNVYAEDFGEEFERFTVEEISEFDYDVIKGNRNGWEYPDGNAQRWTADGEILPS